MDHLEYACISKNAQFTAPLKALKTALNLIISRQFLSEFTWTGKSKPGIRKLPFRDYKGIESLLYAIITQMHPKYDKKTFHKDLVDKILKFAYE